MRAAQQAKQQAGAQQLSSCTDSAKGLRMSIMADKMQQRLDASKGLSAKERADFEADIKATRDAADQKLDYAPPVDLKNPNRAMIRLTAQDQAEVTTEFSNRYLGDDAELRACSGAGAECGALSFSGPPVGHFNLLTTQSNPEGNPQRVSP